MAPEEASRLTWLTPEIEEVQSYHADRVASVYRGVPPSDVVSVAGPTFGRSHGLAGTNEIDMLERPEEWLEDVVADMSSRKALLTDRITFQPMAIELDPLGTHYIDAIFGAEVYFHQGQVWSDRVDYDVAELRMPNLSASRVFTRSLELARRAMRVSRGRLFIAAPVLSCPINIGINLFGDRLLEALADRPEAARRAVSTITDVIIACTKAFRELIPDAVRRTSVACNRYAPPGYGLIDGCATQLTSARHYRQFLAPLDEKILAVYPHGGMIHLCGRQVQHIPSWREMAVVKAVQLNDRAAEDLEAYYLGLRPDQILYVTPTPSMTVARIMEVTGGERLILQCQLGERLGRLGHERPRQSEAATARLHKVGGSEID